MGAPGLCLDTRQYFTNAQIQYNTQSSLNQGHIETDFKLDPTWSNLTGSLTTTQKFISPMPANLIRCSLRWAFYFVFLYTVRPPCLNFFSLKKLQADGSSAETTHLGPFRSFCKEKTFCHCHCFLIFPEIFHTDCLKHGRRGWRVST